jgi:hypothetical protein
MRQGAGDFEQAICKGALAMIDMSDDREVSDVLKIYHQSLLSFRSGVLTIWIWFVRS